jgi:hypothetical protein
MNRPDEVASCDCFATEKSAADWPPVHMTSPCAIIGMSFVRKQ